MYRYVTFSLVAAMLAACGTTPAGNAESDLIKLRVLVSVQYLSEEDMRQGESTNTYIILIDGSEVMRQSFTARGFGHDRQPEPILELEPGRREIEFRLLENGKNKKIRKKVDEDFALTVAYMRDSDRLVLRELPFTFVVHIE